MTEIREERKSQMVDFTGPTYDTSGAQLLDSSLCKVSRGRNQLANYMPDLTMPAMASTPLEGLL